MIFLSSEAFSFIKFSNSRAWRKVSHRQIWEETESRKHVPRVSLKRLATSSEQTEAPLRRKCKQMRWWSVGEQHMYPLCHDRIKWKFQVELKPEIASFSKVSFRLLKEVLSESCVTSLEIFFSKNLNEMNLVWILFKLYKS